MKCIVNNCNNNDRSKKLNGIKFHKRPANEAMSQKWINALHLQTSQKNFVICSNHFDQKYKYGSGLLTCDAIPTILIDPPIISAGYQGSYVAFQSNVASNLRIGIVPEEENCEIKEESCEIKEESCEITKFSIRNGKQVQKCSSDISPLRGFEMSNTVNMTDQIADADIEAQITDTESKAKITKQKLCVSSALMQSTNEGNMSSPIKGGLKEKLSSLMDKLETKDKKIRSLQQKVRRQSRKIAKLEAKLKNNSTH